MRGAFLSQSLRMNMIEKKKLVIITGFSCSGKSYLQEELVSRGWTKPASFTTRKKRFEDEVDDYVFLDKYTFGLKEWRGDFIGATKYNQNYYWTGKFSNDNVVAIFTSSWAEDAIKKCSKEYDITLIYLDIDRDVQMDRLVERWSSADEIERRLSIDSGVIYPHELSVRMDGQTPIDKLANEVEWLTEQWIELS